MIDTDKYEGHTPAPWHPFDGTNSHGYGWEIRLPTHKYDAHSINTTMTGGHYIDIGVRKNRLSETDARLIADAPLLLAEVKRLREAALKAREVLMKHYEWMSVNDATSEEDDQEILDTVKQLREASE